MGPRRADGERAAAGRLRAPTRRRADALRPRAHRERDARVRAGSFPTTSLRVNPHDLAALGVDSGTEVKITAARASLTRPVVGDPAVPVGVAALAFPADGTGPALIIDTAAPVTDVRVETLR